MKSTFRILSYAKWEASDEAKMLPIYVRITINGTKARFSLKIRVSEKIWDAKSGRAIGHSHEALQANRYLDATAKCPAAIGVGAVVHKAVFAEETLAAEGLHIDRNAVARLDISDLGADLLNHANHLVANGNAGHSTRHTAVLDMQIAGVDTAECIAHNNIKRTLQFGLRLVN